MIRFLAATLIVACLAPFVFAEGQPSRTRGYRLKSGEAVWFIEEEDGKLVFSGVTKDAALRNRYLNLARERAEQLSASDLRQEIEQLELEQAKLKKERERKRIADEIDKRLMADVEFLQKIAKEHPGTEAASIASELRETRIGEIAKVRNWKQGTLKTLLFPTSPITPDLNRVRD